MIEDASILKDWAISQLSRVDRGGLYAIQAVGNGVSLSYINGKASEQIGFYPTAEAAAEAYKTHTPVEVRKIQPAEIIENKTIN